MLVTRAAHQASPLADALTGYGLEVIAVPAIEIAEPLDGYDSLDAALEDVDAFDWLIFTSANAVAIFAERCRELAVQPAAARIASIGAATSRALHDAGFRADLQPHVAVAESLAAALEPHARDARMLLVRAEQGRDELPILLRQWGAEVAVAAAYRNTVPETSVRLLKQVSGSFDAITFTSSSSVTNLLALFAEAKLPFPREAVLASIGPITSTTLREEGFAPAVEASVAQVEVLAAELARYLRTRSAAGI